MNSEIEKFVKEQMNLEVDGINKIGGDASSRVYYEIKTRKANHIACVETPNSQQSNDFIRMYEFINNKVRTPKVLAYDLSKSIIIQEHIGSDSFNFFVANNVKERSNLLCKAVDNLKKYQTIDTSEFMNEFNRSFDKEKIIFEIDLAVKYFIKEYHRKNLGSDEEKLLENFKQEVVDHFEKSKDVVCHRDYHGRNLHIHKDELINIDFQDARIGPREYDLCSLLDDSYFRLDDNLKQELKERFYRDNQNYYKSYEDFEARYNIVVIQRIFKALGSFTFLKFEKNKDGYEKYISNAMENLRSYLEKSQRFEDFRALITGLYYAN